MSEITLCQYENKYAVALMELRKRYKKYKLVSRVGEFYYDMHLIYDIVSMKEVFRVALEQYVNEGSIDLDLLFLRYEDWDTYQSWKTGKLILPYVMFDDEISSLSKENMVLDYIENIKEKNETTHKSMYEVVRELGELESMNKEVKEGVDHALQGLTHTLKQLREKLSNPPSKETSIWLFQTFYNTYNLTSADLRTRYTDAKNSLLNDWNREMDEEQMISWIWEGVEALDESGFWVKSMSLPYSERAKERLLQDYSEDMGITEDCYLRFRLVYNLNKNRYVLNKEVVGRYMYNHILKRELSKLAIIKFVDFSLLVEQVYQDIERLANKDMGVEVKEGLQEIAVAFSRDKKIEEDVGEERMSRFFEELLADGSREEVKVLVDCFIGSGSATKWKEKLSVGPVVRMIGVLERNHWLKDLDNGYLNKWLEQGDVKKNMDSWKKYRSEKQDDGKLWTTKGDDKGAAMSAKINEYIEEVMKNVKEINIE